MKFLIIFLCLIALPQKALALCIGSTLSSVPATSTYVGPAGGYSVYDSTEHMQTVNFSVDTVASVGGCKYYMVLSAGSSGSAAQRKMSLNEVLDYNVYTTSSKSNVLNSSGSYNGSGVISGIFGYILNVQQSSSQNIYWTIRPGQIIKANPGFVTDSGLTLDLYAELVLGIYTKVDSKSITFRTKVESDIDLSLVDTSGVLNLGDTSQTVNFGNLSSGQILNYDTMVRSNCGYIISMQSQNKQRLAHESAPAVTTTIPYSLSVGGSVVNLTSGSAVQVAASTLPTPLEGDRKLTRFTIGTMTGSEPSGNYQDIITVTITSN